MNNALVVERMARLLLLRDAEGLMGRKERTIGPLPPLTLEELVLAAHLYRYLDQALDLSFVRNLVREAYAGSERPSIDPVVFFTLQLIRFVEGVRSERQLMQIVAGLLWRTRFRWTLQLRQITGDTKDGTAAHRAAIERGRIHASVPRSSISQRTGMLGEQDVVDAAGADVSRGPGKNRCVAVHPAQPRRAGAPRLPLWSARPARSGTSARHPGGDDAWDGASRPSFWTGRVTTTRLNRTRGHDASGRCGWTRASPRPKLGMGLRRFRVRGLEKVNSEALLVATGQNPKRSWAEAGVRSHVEPPGKCPRLSHFDLL